MFLLGNTVRNPFDSASDHADLKSSSSALQETTNVAQIPVAVRETAESNNLLLHTSAPHSPVLFKVCKRRSIKQKGEPFLLTHLFCVEALAKAQWWHQLFQAWQNVALQAEASSSQSVASHGVRFRLTEAQRQGSPCQNDLLQMLHSAKTLWEMICFYSSVVFHRGVHEGRFFRGGHISPPKSFRV